MVYYPRIIPSSSTGKMTFTWLYGLLIYWLFFLFSENSMPIYTPHP